MGPCGMHLPPEPPQPLLATASPSQQNPLRCCFSIPGRAMIRQTRGTAGSATKWTWGTAGSATRWTQTRGTAGSVGHREAACHLPTRERSRPEAPASCMSLSFEVSQDGSQLGRQLLELQPPHPSPTLCPLLSSSVQGPTGTEQRVRPHLQGGSCLAKP